MSPQFDSAHLEGVVQGGGEEEVPRRVEGELCHRTGVRLVVLQQLVGTHVPDLYSVHTNMRWIDSLNNSSGLENHFS